MEGKRQTKRETEIMMRSRGDHCELDLLLRIRLIEPVLENINLRKQFKIKAYQ